MCISPRRSGLPDPTGLASKLMSSARVVRALNGGAGSGLFSFAFLKQPVASSEAASNITVHQDVLESVERVCVL